MSSSGGTRKSQRLRGPEIEASGPLRRSGRENKFQSPTAVLGSRPMKKGGLNPGPINKASSSDLSANAGDKRKRRIDARHFKAMFQFNDAGGSETELKKRRVESCSGNADSSAGDPIEGISGNCCKGVDSVHLLSKEGLKVSCNEHGDGGLRNPDKGLQESCDEVTDRSTEEPKGEPQECSDGEGIEERLENCENGVDSGHMIADKGFQAKCDEHEDSNLSYPHKGLQENGDVDSDRGIKEREEEPLECSVREEMEEDVATNEDGGTEGQYFDVKKNFCVEKPCDLEHGKGLIVSGSQNLSISTTLETLAEKNGVNAVVGEMDSCVKEKLLIQEMTSGPGRLSDLDNGQVCSQKELVIGSSGLGGVGTHTNMKITPCESPTYITSSLTLDSPKCSKHLRLDHDSLKHELCRNLTNSDGGECSNTPDENSQILKKSVPPVDADQGLCVICKCAGNLLTHAENAHNLSWYCSECMKIKLTLGVHSQSEGVESIFDEREVELSNSEGSHKEKQYFVKYKGLAHIHNCWISETQLLHEAPQLLVKRCEQDKLWKPEWAVPHRLLIRSSDIADSQNTDVASKSRHEWLVKWCHLDYDQATWELEDSDFFNKPETQQLLEEYKIRHSGARSSSQQLLKEFETCLNESRNSSISGDNKVQERKKNLQVKHGRLSDSLRFESVNKLPEFLQKRHNVLLLDEQDRAMKIIYFISSIMSSVHRPFLIIAPRESLTYWEAEFLRFTPSINVLVYGGNADSRKIIRSLEFYREGGELMYQVLLSTVEAIYEDLEEIKGMNWEAVIIDDCQEHCIWGNSGCIKTFVSNWKILLFNAQLKDTIDDYFNIMSLLEPVGDSNQFQGLMDASNKDINALKERVCSFIIAPRFQEYWVPVEISNVQLEQYCSIMLSKSSVLCISSKNDRMGSLQDILMSTQKCCDHPYLVNPSLRTRLLPEQPAQDAALDMGVRSGAKLQLLDELLSEFRNRGLKVLILFQVIGGSGKDNLDIILDDFLAWRFGENSFEHVASGTQISTKKAALKKFNRESDRSFLLLESRACNPSIKLSSVDSVIILNSDWNPLNDIKALQKIVIDSKLKTINIFRFYCSCTVEEKALIIAKNDTIPDPHQISPSIKQNLLMWGSAYLFSRLDEFHRDKVLDYRAKIDFGAPFMKNVCQEIVSLVQNHGNVNSSRYISLAQQDGRCYFTTVPLLGEQRTQLEEGVSSHTFWMKLFEGKQPKWEFLSVSSERNRKRVHYSNEKSLPRNLPTDEPKKKRKDSSPRQVGQNPEKRKDINMEDHVHPDISIEQQDDKKRLHEQRGFFDILKPIVLNLCETLMFKDEVKRLAERFLEFVLNNHPVTRKPDTILQAFQISVCWIAAEVLEKRIDHKRSLNIARDKMNFKCQEEETQSMYSRIKQLMKIFLSRNCKKYSIGPSSAVADSTSVLNENRANISVGSLDKVAEGPDGIPFATNSFSKENHSQLQLTNNAKYSLENADKCKKKCEKKIKRLQEKQNDELIDFEKSWEKKRVELEDTYKLESAVIRYSHANSSALVDKVKILDNDYVKKRKDLESEFSSLRKDLEARQQEERDGVEKKIAQLLKLVKPASQDELLEKPQFVNSVQLQLTEGIGPWKEPNGILPVKNPPKDQSSDGEASRARLPEVINQMADVLMVEAAAPESDRINGASTLVHSVSTEQTRSPISTFTKQQTADETSIQGLGDKPCQQGVEGVEEQARPLIVNNDASPDGETSLLDPDNPVPTTLPHGEGTSVVPPAELSFPLSLGCDQTGVASSGQLNSQSNEVQVYLQNLGSRVQNVPQAVVAHIANANLGQGPTYASTTRGTSIARANHQTPISVVTPTISRVSSSYHSDPLQSEYDRIQKEIGDITNVHEEMKLRLRSECEKEIEELVAQIRRKYGAKLEEAESSFSLKKNELETNQNIVMMNKFLADALRSKCMDYKAAPQGGIRKGTPASFQDPLFQVQRPFSGSRSSSVGTSAASADGATPSVRGDNHPPLLPSGHTLIDVQHIQPTPAMPSNNMQYSDILPPQPSNNNQSAASSLPPASQSTPDQSNQALNLTSTAEELFVDIVRQNDANIHRLSDNLPALSDNVLNHECWDVPLIGTEVDVQQPAGEVVCLSDDDD